MLEHFTDMGQQRKSECPKGVEPMTFHTLVRYSKYYRVSHDS